MGNKITKEKSISLIVALSVALAVSARVTGHAFAKVPTHKRVSNPIASSDTVSPLLGL